MHPQGGYDTVEEDFRDDSCAGLDRVVRCRRGGLLHRLDGPAVVSQFSKEMPFASRYVASWFHDGRRHRDDGPAQVMWNRFGVVTYAGWWSDGRRHREDGPATMALDDHPGTRRHDEPCAPYWWWRGAPLAVAEVHRLLVEGLAPDVAQVAVSVGQTDRELLVDVVARHGSGLARECLEAGLGDREGIGRVAAGEPVEWVVGYFGR